MSSESVNLTIDGISVSVAKGTSIIEAAKQAGVLIPHYCYHPSLPSPAVCRMCLVEVEKSPKLVPACVTVVADGQVVHTGSETARKAREGVLEFLLINHPLDCPVCDQAGECELQDYVFQEGRSGTRYADFPKRYNPVEDFGPDILYVANRCILCTRCVRFMDSVAESPVLNVSERGDRAFIGIDPGERLDHPWAGNVVDLCPVGSLISKDFLHKARAWDLDKTASICPGCTQGCNITIQTRDEAVVRLQPRPNHEVNRHFMCDHGRADYHWMNRGDRLEAPLQRHEDRLRAGSWVGALARLAELLRAAEGSTVVLASGRASTESLGWIHRLVAISGGVAAAAVKVPLGDEAPLPGVPGLALRRERIPNLEGARLSGFSDDWKAGCDAAGRAALVIILDQELTPDEVALFDGSRNLVWIGTTEPEWAMSRCDLLLPITPLPEENGTYLNRDGRVQRFLQARGSRGMAIPAWKLAAETLALLEPRTAAPATTEQAFAMLGDWIPALAGIRYSDLGLGGRQVAILSQAGAA